jgi:hypothetical protein
MDSSVSPKDEIWFLRVCHHISNAVYAFSCLRYHVSWYPFACLRYHVLSIFIFTLPSVLVHIFMFTLLPWYPFSCLRYYVLSIFIFTLPSALVHIFMFTLLPWYPFSCLRYYVLSIFIFTLPSVLVHICMQGTVRTDAHACRSHVFAVFVIRTSHSLCWSRIAKFPVLCMCVCVCVGTHYFISKQHKSDCTGGLEQIAERERERLLCALGVVEFVHKWNEHMHSSFACYLQESGCDTVC